MVDCPPSPLDRMLVDSAIPIERVIYLFEHYGGFCNTLLGPMLIWLMKDMNDAAAICRRPFRA